MTVVREYIRKMESATEYQRKSLEFRVIYGLKREVNLNKKAR